MAVFTILYGNYYPPHGEFKLICIGKFDRRTWVNFTQQYGKNRQRCQQNKFIMLYGNYCYIFIENFPQKFSPCSDKTDPNRPKLTKHFFFRRKQTPISPSFFLSPLSRIWNRKIVEFFLYQGRLPLFYSDTNVMGVGNEVNKSQRSQRASVSVCRSRMYLSGSRVRGLVIWVIIYSSQRVSRAHLSVIYEWRRCVVGQSGTV